jgi:hypothetical protein
VVNERAMYYVEQIQNQAAVIVVVNVMNCLV